MGMIHAYHSALALYRNFESKNDISVYVVLKTSFERHKKVQNVGFQFSYFFCLFSLFFYRLLYSFIQKTLNRINCLVYNFLNSFVLFSLLLRTPLFSRMLATYPRFEQNRGETFVQKTLNGIGCWLIFPSSFCFFLQTFTYSYSVSVFT